MLTRLQRFLADCGVASRRECEQMIMGGRVQVNGRVQTEMPVMINPEKDVVTVDDHEINAPGTQLAVQQKVYFLLNKPKGILVTNKDPADRKTVGELMTGIKERVFPVGRLDMDARGALILTNDGELANRLTHPRYGIEKTYIVEVDGRIGPADIEKIKRGMWLGPQQSRSPNAPAPAPEAPSRVPGNLPRGAFKTERFHVKVIGRERGRSILELKISEAKNSDIRRVMARIGHVVRDLNRVAIAGKITIKGIDPGEHRPLTPAEVKWLLHASSPEFHGQQQAETQQWYEAKEMEKERKRIEREKDMPAPPVVVKKPTAEEKKAEREEKKTRARPERKGKKPFVPPSGRNAGKAIGGNYIGKKRLQEAQFDDFDEPLDAPEISAPSKSKPSNLPAHPLGGSAMSDDD